MTKEELLKELIKDLEEVGVNSTDAKIYYDLWLIADEFRWYDKDSRLSDLLIGYVAEDVILDKIFNMIHPEQLDADGIACRNDEDFGCDLQDILDYIGKLANETDCHNAVYIHDSYGIWKKVPREELLQIKDKMMTILKEELK